MTLTRTAEIDLLCEATATVPGHVRALIELRLTEWGLADPAHETARESLRLIATELVSNALAETPERRIRIHCALDPARAVVRCAVWDSSPRMPRARMPELTLDALDLAEENADANGGWGLPLVVALSAATGVEPTTDPRGKWAWAEVRI